MEGKGGVLFKGSSSCHKPSHVKTKELKGRASVFALTVSQMDVCLLCLWPFHVDMFAVLIFMGLAFGETEICFLLTVYNVYKWNSRELKGLFIF